MSVPFQLAVADGIGAGAGGVPAVFGSRRTLLSSLGLSGLLLLTSMLFVRNLPVGVKIFTWGLFAWSLVVTAYAVFTYVAVRRSAHTVGNGMTDPLTGLLNRKGLITALEEYDLDVEQFGRRVRLIDVDLANLDRVNHEFGQSMGDVVLQDIADLLRRTAPGSALVGRLGGDEFLLALPGATDAETDRLAAALRVAVADYSLNLGDRGEVGGLKAHVSVAAYLPDHSSLHETVRCAKEASVHGRLPDGAGQADETAYHVPRVTLGAFAVHRWQNLSEKARGGFTLWQRSPADGEFLEAMVSDIVRMLDGKAEVQWVDFVTTPPAAGTRVTPGRRLAEAVAKQLGVPYRDVMRADTSGPETRSVEPAVGAFVDRGAGALLVTDVIGSGILERRCVRKLSAAGVRVQVAAWAAY